MRSTRTQILSPAMTCNPTENRAASGGSDRHPPFACKYSDFSSTLSRLGAFQNSPWPPLLQSQLPKQMLAISCLLEALVLSPKCQQRCGSDRHCPSCEGQSTAHPLRPCLGTGHLCPESWGSSVGGAGMWSWIFWESSPACVCSQGGSHTLPPLWACLLLSAVGKLTWGSLLGLGNTVLSSCPPHWLASA